MPGLIRFGLNIHIPLFILGQLLIIDNLPQDRLFFFLSLNIVFVLTSATYLCILFAKKSIPGIPPKSYRRRQAPPIYAVLFGWSVFFIFFQNYIEGGDWVSVAYVMIATWSSWFFASRKNNDIHDEVIHPLGLISYEFLSVGFAIGGAYALYDGNFIVNESWVWVALIFVNISLIVNESLFLMNRKKILSKKMVSNIIFTYIALFTIPMLASLYTS